MRTAFYMALTLRDLDALAVYLRSVPAIRNEVPSVNYRKSVTHGDAPYADKVLGDADMKNPRECLARRAQTEAANGVCGYAAMSAEDQNAIVAILRSLPLRE